MYVRHSKAPCEFYRNPTLLSTNQILITGTHQCYTLDVAHRNPKWKSRMFSIRGTFNNYCTQIAVDLKQQLGYIFADDGLHRIDFETNEDVLIDNVFPLYQCPVVFHKNYLYVINEGPDGEQKIDLGQRNLFGTAQDMILFKDDSFDPEPQFSDIWKSGDGKEHLLTVVKQSEYHGCIHEAGNISIHTFETGETRELLFDHRFGHVDTGYCLDSTKSRYLFSFGGMGTVDLSPNYLFSNKISFVDLETLTLYESSVRCPSSSSYYAICLETPENLRELLFAGYARKFVQTLMDNNEVLEIPKDVVSFAAARMSMELIHLFEIQEDQPPIHYTIKLCDIIDNIACIPRTHSKLMCSLCYDTARECPMCCRKFGRHCDVCGKLYCLDCVKLQTKHWQFKSQEWTCQQCIQIE